jgi:hypothetical protein
VRITALLLFCAASTSLANLGETLKQTIGRYGPILKKEQVGQPPDLNPSDATIQYGFEKNGFRITVSFVNGKCAWILYSKPDGPIYDIDLRTLLDNNAEGSQWNDGHDVTDSVYKKGIRYSRADGRANAEYVELGDDYHALSIIAKAWRDATSAASGL